ncbi:hypothetical protein TNCV_3109321 [Trichonephila clavipes]|nr:hypothetical protein TNCV_3109321 [Trichonephila clavipes]
MDGKSLSDKSIQDCLFNNPPSLPEKTLLWPIESMNGKPVLLQMPSQKRILFEHYWSSTPENEESLKDPIDSAKEEPESVLETHMHVNGMNDSNVTGYIYHLETHHLFVIHRQVYRNFVETCILNIPVGTELQVNGCKNEYITNTFVQIKDGFLYNPLDHSHESNCFVSRYVSNPTGWILTRKAMLDLILSGFPKPSLYRLHGSCQGTDLDG